MFLVENLGLAFGALLREGKESWNGKGPEKCPLQTSHWIYALVLLSAFNNSSFRQPRNCHAMVRRLFTVCATTSGHQMTGNDVVNLLRSTA